jgi:hypothetical protein
MKDKSMKVSFKKLANHQWMLVLFGLLVVVAAVIPSGSWSPSSDYNHLGPQSYDSSLGKRSKILWNPTGPASRPDFLKMRFEYKVNSRPSGDTSLVSTSPRVDGGIKFVLDRWGNLFAQFESHPSSNSSFQLIKVSEPQDLNEWFKIALFIDLNEERLQLSVNGIPVLIQEARPGEVISVADMIVENSEISIGGLADSVFPGEIRAFDVIWGKSKITIDLINLKLSTLLLSMIALSVFFNQRRQIHLVN